MKTHQSTSNLHAALSLPSPVLYTLSISNMSFCHGSKLAGSFLLKFSIALYVDKGWKLNRMCLTPMIMVQISWISWQWYRGLVRATDITKSISDFDTLLGIGTSIPWCACVRSAHGRGTKSFSFFLHNKLYTSRINEIWPHRGWDLRAIMWESGMVCRAEINTTEVMVP
jgi:hypothetical protein